MVISIDWATKVISVPKADLSLVSIGPPEIRSLDVDQFRKDLNALQASEIGMAFDTTHENTPPKTIGGVTYARLIEIINGYTVTFEAGAYAVNLAGANNNISDVTNLNSVSIRSSNSAGLTFSAEILEIWTRLWLDPNNPMTAENIIGSLKSADNAIDISITGAPTSRTATRQ